MLTPISENQFNIESLGHLLTLVDLVSPKQLVIAADLLGKNETVLLRAGQPLSSTVLNYLKSNDNYVPEFSIQSTPELCESCQSALIKKIESTIASQRINALTRAASTMKTPLVPLLMEAFKDSRLLLTLFTLQAFGEEPGRFLFEHSIHTGVLTLGIAGELDEKFHRPPYSTEAFRAGLVHDLTLTDYLDRVDEGQEAVEHKAHTVDSAALAGQWGMHPYAIEAIRRRHEDYNEDQDKSKQGEERTFTLALATAERFATLCDLLGRSKEDEACFMVAHLADQGKLNTGAVRALGLVIHAKQIVSDVERLSQIENLCPKGDAAYVYPKVVHATPTKVVCKRNIEECPLFLASEPPLVVLNQAGETSLADGMLALAPGEYRKCALSSKLVEAVR